MKKLTADEMLELAHTCGTIYGEARYERDPHFRLLSKAFAEIYIGVRVLRNCGNKRLLAGLEAARQIAAAPVTKFDSSGILGSILSSVYGVEELLGAGHVGRTKTTHHTVLADGVGYVDACFAIAKNEWNANRAAQPAAA